MNLRRHIAELVSQAFARAQESGALPSGVGQEVVVERPQQPEHGDLATSLPLKLARPFRMNPMQIAEAMVTHLAADEAVASAKAAHPGFINFRLDDHWLARQVDDILQQGEAYGDSTAGRGRRVQVEFVSVNPTGPVHVGHARGAVLGSGLASILQAAGYDVTREYYVNDAGSQMEAFYRSLYARYLQALGEPAEVPENGYRGEYVVELGGRIASEHGDRFQRMPEQEAVHEIGRLGLDETLQLIREDLEQVGIHFDVWFSERDLYSGGQYEHIMRLLGERGYLAEREGAVWFTSTALGEDKDNVLVRSDGTPTYFASDVAYHYDKLVNRGFDRVVDVWGADHQGHVPRMKAVLDALGLDPGRLVIIISQMVSLKSGGEALKMSKRAGDLVTMRDLVDEVGPDACRYFFLARSAETQMEFDLELAKQESSDNPVYYVQYAHARIASILRNAAGRGIDYRDGDVSLLVHEAELALLRKMVEFPELVEVMARSLTPHHLPHYAVDLATAFHWFYQQCRVLSDDLPLTQARLRLTAAARHVLARSLHLMGMGAPERM